MRLVVLTALIVSIAAGTSAQTMPAGVEPGDQVVVILRSGELVSGPVTLITSTHVEVRGRRISLVDVAGIERPGDPVWDGIAIGAGVGAGVGALIAMGECGIDLPPWKCIVAGTTWGVALGALFDWSQVGRVTVYPSYESDGARRPASFFPVGLLGTIEF